MAGLMWVSDREPSVRTFFADVLPEAEILAPDELEARVSLGQRPDSLVIDGTQLLELSDHARTAVLSLPRVLICTGMLLSSMPMSLVSSPGVALLAKPFCIEDLEAAIDWLRGSATGPMPQPARDSALVEEEARNRSRRLPAG